MRAQMLDAGDLRDSEHCRVQRGDLVHLRVRFGAVRPKPGLHRRDPLQLVAFEENGAKTSPIGIVRSVSVCAGTGWKGWNPPGRNFVATTCPLPVSCRRKRLVTTPYTLPPPGSKTMWKLGWVTTSCVNGSLRSQATTQWRSTRCARSAEGA